METCCNLGLTTFEAEACGWRDSGVLDSAMGRSLYLEKFLCQCSLNHYDTRDGVGLLDS